MVNTKLITEVEEKVMQEMNYYFDDLRTKKDKNEHIQVSLTVNKLANTILQAENTMQRAKENELKAKENTRLVKRFGK